MIPSVIKGALSDIGTRDSYYGGDETFVVFWLHFDTVSDFVDALRGKYRFFFQEYQSQQYPFGLPVRMERLEQANKEYDLLEHVPDAQLNDEPLTSFQHKLYRAVRSLSVDTVEAVLKQKSETDVIEPDIVHYAVTRCGDPTMLKMLIDAKAHVGYALGAVSTASIYKTDEAIKRNLRAQVENLLRPVTPPEVQFEMAVQKKPLDLAEAKHFLKAISSETSQTGELNCKGLMINAVMQSVYSNEGCALAQEIFNSESLSPFIDIDVEVFERYISSLEGDRRARGETILARMRQKRS
eukprot:TRINITY_DN7225_c0_g1_i1.p1 TRINITY_DN7225_c0_g1~~TRINITY_DN7225_c0_g1_i1.p1  ORF type:complete len:296 (-),score=22.72 TRINITY_DN7225_c0_g1_i1:116-1003(-)